jgi:hypothetical protein
MKTRLIVLLLLVAALCCVAQDVRYNFASGEDFSKYHTYKWVPLDGSERINQMAEEQLKASVDAEMTKKGLTKTDSDTADLYLAYQAAVGQEKQFTSYNTDWGYGPGWGGRYYGGMGGGGMTTGQTSTIYVGQVTLDMYDSAQKKLVWRGIASKTLDAKAKPEKQKKNLDKAIAKLLKNFPPKPKS